jgi:hypothetical protein
VTDTATLPASPKVENYKKTESVISFLPSVAMIKTRILEIRKRRGLMFAVYIFTVGVPILIYGIREILHLVNPNTYGLPGSAAFFGHITTPMTLFGFIIAATLGASATSTDYSEGFFRLLVATGRSRVSMYFSRILAGTAILVPLVGIAFAIVCLVTSFAGTPQNSTVNFNGVQIPAYMSESQLKTWIVDHPSLSGDLLQNGGPISNGFGGSRKVAPISRFRNSHLKNTASPTISNQVMTSVYGAYVANEIRDVNPPINEMIKVGLWLELMVYMGFLIGAGLGSLMGQRTVPVIFILVLQLVLTPIVSSVTISHFINAQRLVIGVALEQLRPIWALGSTGGNGGSGSGPPIGGAGSLGIGPMPEWAMIVVIAGWAVAVTYLGAWKMANRDA